MTSYYLCYLSNWLESGEMNMFIKLFCAANNFVSFSLRLAYSSISFLYSI